ncbi:MAG TPA: YfiR family protein [Myxococcota bacterium]|jgi:hypothetical protein
MRRIFLAFMVAVVSALFVAPAAQANSDDQARATFLLLLGKYVTWPANAFSSDTAPIVVAVVGNPKLVTELQTLSRGQVIETRPIEIRVANDAADCAGAHIVFVSDSVQSNALAASQPLRVSEKPGRLSDTDIAIRMQAGRIAFSVNQKDVARRGLKLSSKLMRLASSFE